MTISLLIIYYTVHVCIIYIRVTWSSYVSLNQCVSFGVMIKWCHHYIHHSGWLCLLVHVSVDHSWLDPHSSMVVIKTHLWSTNITFIYPTITTLFIYHFILSLYNILFCSMFNFISNIMSFHFIYLFLCFSFTFSLFFTLALFFSCLWFLFEKMETNYIISLGRLALTLVYTPIYLSMLETQRKHC